MQPGARLAAVMALLQAADEGSAPLERIVRGYFRVRRYAGSGDRRAIGQLLYALLRRREELRLRIERAGGVPCSRLEVVAAAHVIQDWPLPELASVCNGENHNPAALDAGELDLLRNLTAVSADTPTARSNCPPWLWDDVHACFGTETEREMTALNQRAPLDFRVNLLKGTLDEAVRLCKKFGLQPEIGALSPWCLRLPGDANVDARALLSDGRLEVQDQGAQVAALLAGVRPGMQVADLCAGAGGKSLAMAAAMKNQGQIYAFDITAQKLAELNKRRQRAGARNIHICPALPDLHDPDRPRHLAPFHGRMDCVLVDAPCSGTGIWRRHPEGRWRLSRALITGLCDRQQALLREAVDLLKPGGRILYVTCALLPAENDAQITTLCHARSELRVLPASKASQNWDSAASLEHCTTPANGLLLTPARTETDGFYYAILQYSPEKAGRHGA